MSFKSLAVSHGDQKQGAPSKIREINRNDVHVFMTVSKVHHDSSQQFDANVESITIPPNKGCETVSVPDTKDGLLLHCEVMSQFSDGKVYDFFHREKLDRPQTPNSHVRGVLYSRGEIALPALFTPRSGLWRRPQNATRLAPMQALRWWADWIAHNDDRDARSGRQKTSTMLRLKISSGGRVA
jgi:hypothetical protein